MIDRLSRRLDRPPARTDTPGATPPRRVGGAPGARWTVTPAFERVSVRGTPRWILAQQARRLRLPLYEIEMPYPCTNGTYEAATRPLPAAVFPRSAPHPTWPSATCSWRT